MFVLFVLFAAVVATGSGVGLGIVVESLGRLLWWVIWRAQEAAKRKFRRGWSNMKLPRGPFVLVAFLVTFFVACASAPAAAPPAASADNDAWHTARVVEAHVNGCKEDCPPTSGDRCIDAYGLCWTRCAWDRSGHDQHLRELLERAALEADPTRSFLVSCDQVHGIEAKR